MATLGGEYPSRTLHCIVTLNFDALVGLFITILG